MLVDHSDALEECSRFVLSDEGCLAGSHRMAASGGNPLCRRGAPLTGCAPAHPGHDSLRSFPTTAIGFCPTRS